MVEVGVGVGLAAGSEERLALAGAHVRDVLHQMRHPLLRVVLVGAAREDLQVRLEATRRRGVLEQDVPQPVRQSAHLV